jgi:hypothetical protein
MADLINLGKRGGKEMAQDSAKTDGMSKGGKTGLGSAPDLLGGLKRSGKEMAQESAPRSFGGK